MDIQFASRDEDETRRLGSRVGRRLRGGDVVLLIGELGTGKTTFTQGVARALGCRDNATSASFVLARTYRGRRWRLHHLDLYRLEEAGSGDVGLEEYLSDPEAATVIEWPAAGRGYLPPDRLEVRFAHAAPEGARRLSFAATGARSREILRALEAG